MLCISMIFSFDNLGKASFILRISAALSLIACTKDLMLLWCLDLARILALGLGRIGGEVLEMLASFSLLGFTDKFGMSSLLKFATIYC